MKKIEKILQALQVGLYEREQTTKLALLAILAGENIFLLGPPGVAKSLISRRLAKVFKQGKSFEYLMSKFSTPEELFGPISISKLKNEDKYHRKTEAYLPGADVVFLDEIWKASSSIQNALLTVINEKVYRNGEQEQKIKLKGLLAASNELPPKGQSLEALWDRFIMRTKVSNIKDEINFTQFLNNNSIQTTLELSETDKIDLKDLEKWQKQIEQVKLSPEVMRSILAIRGFIQVYNQNPENKQPIYVSDRRWRKVVKILKTSAFFNNRKETSLADALLIANCIWDTEAHIQPVRQFVQKSIENHAFQTCSNTQQLKAMVKKLKNEIKELKTQIEPTLLHQGYYRINSPKSSYHKHYIPKSNYDQLDKRSYIEIKICESISGYETWGNPHGKWMMAMKKSPSHLKIKDSNETEEVELEHTALNQSLLQPIAKKISTLKKELTRAQKQLRQQRPKDTHLFINPNLIPIAQKGMKKGMQQLTSIQLTLDKMNKDYEQLSA